MPPDGFNLFPYAANYSAREGYPPALTGCFLGAVEAQGSFSSLTTVLAHPLGFHPWGLTGALGGLVPLPYGKPILPGGPAGAYD